MEPCTSSGGSEWYHGFGYRGSRGLYVGGQSLNRSSYSSLANFSPTFAECQRNLYFGKGNS